jgi:alcohol dehydrogenase (cytochrome c)
LYVDKLRHAKRVLAAPAARPASGETFGNFLCTINIQTGEIAWEVPQVTIPATASAGVFPTASGLVFFGENSGSCIVVGATNGKTLWQFRTNQGWKASPMTYMFDHKQYVAIAVGQNIIVFGLP